MSPSTSDTVLADRTRAAVNLAHMVREESKHLEWMAFDTQFAVHASLLEEAMRNAQIAVSCLRHVRALLDEAVALRREA